MSNPKLEIVKSQLIEFVRYSYLTSKSSDYEHFVYSFLFDNITFLSDIEFSEIDKTIFLEYKASNVKLEKVVLESLSFFLETLRDTRKNKPTRYRVKSKEKSNVNNIFIGLTFSGNNDSSYKDIPAALSLAAFKV